MEPAKILVDQEHEKVKYIKRTRVVRKKGLSIPPTLLILGAASLVVLLCLVYVGQDVAGMHLTLQIKELEKEYRLSQQRFDHLQVTLSSAQSLAAIEGIARQELGMVAPKQATMLVTDVTPSPGESGGNWLATNDSGDTSVFVVVANWINSWLPLGGVEAGRLRR